MITPVCNECKPGFFYLGSDSRCECKNFNLIYKLFFI